MMRCHPGRRGAGRAVLLGLLVGLLSVSLMLTQQRAAEALVVAPVPGSLVLQSVGTGAVACAASVVCGAVAITGAVVCLVYCDDIVSWANGRITGNGAGPSGGGTVAGDTFRLLSGPTPQLAENDANRAVCNAAFCADDGRAFVIRHAPVSINRDGEWCCYAHDANLSTQVTCRTSAGAVSSFTFEGGTFPSSRNGSLPYRDYRVPSRCAVGAFPTEFRVWAFSGSGLCNDPNFWLCGGQITWTDTLAAEDTRPYRATVTCRTAAGATATGTATATTATTLTPPDCEAILPGSYRERLVLERNVGTAAAPQWEPAGETQVDLTNHPECKPGGSAYPCQLVRAFVSPSNPDECTWGPYIMPPPDCETLPPPAEPSPGPSPSASPGASPGPTTVPAPPVYDPNMPDPYAPVNPETGGGTRLNPDGSQTTTEVQPDGTTVTRTQLPDGSTVTTTRPPGGPASTVRTPPLGTGISQGPDPDGKNCISGAFSFNPINWVYIPVKCVLQWAFIPSQASAEQINALRAEAGARPPVSIGTWAAGAVPGFGDGFGAATSCTALPDFDPAQLGRARLPCKPDYALYDVGFVLVQLFLVAVTGLYVWGMAQRALQASGGEVV